MVCNRYVREAWRDCDLVSHLGTGSDVYFNQETRRIKWTDLMAQFQPSTRLNRPGQPCTGDDLPLRLDLNFVYDDGVGGTETRLLWI